MSSPADPDSSPSLLPIDVFVQNLARTYTLVDLLGASSRAITEEVEVAKKLVALNPHIDWNSYSEWLKLRKPLLENRAPMILEWLCVLTVTITETYLFDSLVTAASNDSSLIGGRKIPIDYEQIQEQTTGRDLKMVVRETWARDHLKGGPMKWTDQFQKWGAKISAAHVTTLDELWGVRHAIVHRSGQAGQDFRRLHPAVPLTDEGRIVVTKEAVAGYMKAATGAVIAVNEFFSKRIQTS